MSLIIGIKKNNCVYLGADTQISGDNGKIFPIDLNENNFKIFKLKGLKNCFCGVCGDVSNSSIIRSLDFNTDKKNENIIINYDFIINKFIPDLIDKLIYYKIDFLKENDKKIFIDNCFLIAQNDKLFYVNSDFSVIEVDTYFAIGSGSTAIQGILYENYNTLDPNQLILKALSFSEKIDLFVSSPFIAVNTCSNKIKFLNKK